MPENPIYKFLKENNLTTKDEQSFTKEYSDPKKAQQLYKFFQDNNLTKKDSASFYDTYFKPVGGVQPSSNQQSVKIVNSQQDIEKSLQNYTATHQYSKNATMGADVGMLPKGGNASEIITKKEKADEEQLNRAVENTFKKTAGKGAYTKEDSVRITNNLKEGVKNGDLGITQDASGNDVVKNKGGFFESLLAANQQAYEQSIEDKYLTSIPKSEAISYLNRVSQYPETGIVKEQDIAPNEAGRMIGEQASLFGKGTIGAIAGARTALTGGASIGSFLAISEDIARSGYAQSLKRNYNILKQQGLTDEEAYDKATSGALVGEAVGLGTGILLSGSVSLKPTTTAAQEGFLNSLKHTVKSSPKPVGSAMVGSVINDITTNALANGNPIDVKQMAENAVEHGKSMAIIHGAMGVLTAVANGRKTLVPSYARPQAENVIASLDRNEVTNYLNQKEQNGELPKGTANKVLTTLSQFDEKKAIVAPFRISEESKAAIAGKLVQKQKLLDELSTLKPNENAFPERIAEINKEISGIDGEIHKLYNAKNVFEKETDSNTGEKNYTAKEFEELKPQEKNGIVVPKEYGDIEVEQKGEGENKTFTAKAYYIDQQGSLAVKKSIPVEGTFTDKSKAQEAADNALKQHYYENGLHENAKPDKKIETEKIEEIPIGKTDEGVAGVNEQKSNFPKPKVPIEQMTYEQLDEYANTVKDYSKNQEVEFFGKEGAKEYRQAKSTSNNSFSEAKRQEAYKIIEKYESQLTPQQRNEFFGINAPEGLVYDHSELSNIANRIRFVEESETLNELASSAEDALVRMNEKNPSIESKAILNAVRKRAEELNIKPEELVKEVIKKVGNKYKDAGDAEFMMQVVLDKLKPKEEEQKILNEPTNSKEDVGEVIQAQQEVKLNDEANELLAKIDKGGSMPTFITKNLEKIANDNGIEVTGKMSAQDVVNALREKSKQSTEPLQEQKTEQQPINETTATSQINKPIQQNETIPTEQEGDKETVQQSPTANSGVGAEGRTAVLDKEQASKFKTIADKIRKGKISDDIAMSGIPFAKEVWNKSIDIVADAVELTGDIVKAVEEGVKYIKQTDWYKNLTEEQKNRAEQRFRKEFEEKELTEDGSNPLIDIKSFSEEPNKTERVRGAYEHLLNSNIPKDVKQKFKDEGITYKISKNESAQKVGKSVVDAFGADEAVKLARLNTFSPSVNSATYASAIDYYRNLEMSANTQSEKFKAAAQWANIYNEYAEKITGAGQFSQYAYNFYKTSPLGFILSAEERLAERRQILLAKDEKSLKGAFELLKDLPEFRELFSKEVSEAVKKSRGEVKAATRKKISDAFDSLKLSKNSAYATLVPPDVINGAIEAMKQVALLGYEVGDIIAEGIKYVNSRHKEGWNEQKFREDFEPVISNLVSDAIVKRPSAQAAEKILAKWEKKLTKLEPQARKELLAKVLNEIVKNGGLEYSKFKEMYADALGLPALTPEMEAKLHTLGSKLNAVDIAKENLDNSPTEENIAAFKKAMAEGEVASREINDLLGDKGITLDRFLSIAKLNTLGVANLLVNPFFNIWFMPVRFLTSLTKTGLDYGLKYAGFERADAIYENTIFKQRGYAKGLVEGTERALKNIVTGDNQFDYFQKATRQNMQPIESIKELVAHHKGEKRLTTAEYANAVMEAFPTMGMTASIISRGLQLGDLPFRFAAERGTAEMIAKQKGLTGAAKEAFILNPDEVSAAKIKDAGERAVMAQDNLVTGMLNSVGNYLKHTTKDSPAAKTATALAKIAGAATQPFLKIPLNSAMTVFELAVPEFSIARGIYHASRGQRDLALESFSKAIVGFSLGLAFTQISQAGLVTATKDNDKKINTSIYQGDIAGAKTLNYTGLKRWLRGGSPKFKDGDITVDMQWLGVPGSIMLMQAQKYDQMKPEDWEKEGYLANLTERMGSSLGTGIKNNVFGNTATLLGALDGSPYSTNKWLRSSSNVLMNAFEPSWLATASKMSDHYKPDYSAMNLQQQLSSSLKERFWMGDGLPKQITVWGEKRTDAPKGVNPLLYYYADITKRRNVDVNDFGYNILALYNKTKEDDVIPSRPQKTIRQNNTSFQLTPKQYEDFQIMVGKNRKDLTRALMSTQKFNSATDDEKIKMLKDVYSDGYDIGKLELEFKYYDIFKKNNVIDEKTTKEKLERKIKKAK